MKKLFTILTLLLVLAISASAALQPVRISVATTPDLTGKALKVSILQASGADFTTAKVIWIKADLTNADTDPEQSVPTDASGNLSFVLSSTVWTGCTYDPNYLVRVTYGTTVLSIERMEVVVAKQGLFGAYVDPSEIVPAANGDVLTTTGGVTQWTQSKEVVKSANMNWFFMPSVSFNTSTLGAGSKDLYNEFALQFGSPSVKCTGAPAGYGVLPTLPAANQIYYYITAYDNTVFSGVSIDANGLMSYTVISTATPCSFINIVFVVK